MPRYWICTLTRLICQDNLLLHHKGFVLEYIDKFSFLDSLSFLTLSDYQKYIHLDLGNIHSYHSHLSALNSYKKLLNTELGPYILLFCWDLAE